MPLPPPTEPNTPEPALSSAPTPTPEPAPLPSSVLAPRIPQQSPKKSSQLVTKILIAAIAVLAISWLGTLVWGVGMQHKYNDVKASADSKYATGQAEGKAQQQKDDQAAFFSQQSAEFRTYKAPDAYGAFEIGFPRAWSFFLTAENGDQLTGIVNPDIVDYTGDKRFATRFGIKDRKFTDVRRDYDNKMKDKKFPLTLTQLSVSGIDSIKYSGNIDHNKSGINSQLVLIPVRDKTMYFQNDIINDDFSPIFDKILASSKINP